MVRVSYEMLAFNVEKLYSKEFSPHDPAIIKHCEFIAEFIRSCGWTEEEYLLRWMAEQEKEHPILISNLHLS